MLTELKTFSALLCFSLCLTTSAAAQKNESAVEVASILSTTVEVEDSMMTLDAMFELIKETSPRVLYERESVRRALEQSFQQRAALLPQIALAASQTRQQFGRGFAGDDFELPPFNSFGTRVEATQTVFDTDKYARYRIAKLEHDIAEMNFEVAVQDILDQAVLLYFTQLRDINKKKIVKDNIERSHVLLKLAQDQLAAGAGVRIDVTRAESRVLGDERELWIAKTRVKTSLLQLKALLDLDLDTDLRLDESLINELKQPPSLAEYEAKGTSLIGSRPELASQKKRLDQALLARKAASWQRLPSVELFGDWGHDSDDAFSGDYNEVWLVGVRASVPIFEGFSIGAQKREAAAAARQASYEMRVLERRIESEFRTSMFEMNSRYKEIELAVREIGLGHDEVKQADLRYREGLADNRELIDAQQRLSDAERSQLDSAYLYGLSRLAFARAIGAVETVLD
ncbi:MAG: outer membrane protein [Lentimonas sp.]|jgi:outer membrane protein